VTNFWFICLCIALVVIVCQGAELVRLRKMTRDPWDAFEKRASR
jgi:hypothetical protein